ncbi:helix-turn-helix domain-containing protein [Candidatus Bipolaricaulota bacterium]|nr:helix-turn-helix domain-containing protein [Candidatus Bipolaricaulota bacterium]
MSDAREDEPTKITLDVGTVYDFFQSLAVLQSPKQYGVRGAWASGMLARLSPASRETLQRAKPVVSYPMHYLPTLPEPKNVETLLWNLSQKDPVERVQALACPWELEARGCTPIFEEVAGQGRWAASDLARLADALKDKDGKAPPEKKLVAMLDVWTDAAVFGEAYVAALRNYYDVFFFEEEKRIRPAIEAAGERIATLAETLALPDLIEEISAGVRFETPPDAAELVLAPSYWITPLLLTVILGEKRRLLVFGARPTRDAIVPGETIPDSLLHALKALADPTRLRTLRLIAEKPMGAAELARALRLRTPTLLHHIHALRLSGLIRIQVPETGAKEKARFSLRPQAVREVMESLAGFLGRAESVDDPDGNEARKIDTNDSSEGGQR